VVPGDKHRDHGGWDMAGHPFDWLGNARCRDEDVDLLLVGEFLRLSFRFGRRRFRRYHYILTRISKGRCAKRQRDKRDAASPHPTG
jgi:hypothetical protein